jgi:hypothetical protein
MMKLSLAVMVCAVIAVSAAPQAPPPTGQKQTLSQATIRGYTQMQRFLLEAAELMAEADYAFRPTPAVRPFGQLISHVALDQFNACAALQGVPSPKAAEKEETPRSKAALIALLKESTTFCDPPVNAMTDDSMVQLMKVGPNELARGLAVIFLNTHANEMYGTMAVYLRLKGLVPPTTALQNAASSKGK